MQPFGYGEKLLCNPHCIALRPPRLFLAPPTRKASGFRDLFGSEFGPVAQTNASYFSGE